MFNWFFKKKKAEPIPQMTVEEFSGITILSGTEAQLRAQQARGFGDMAARQQMGISLQEKYFMQMMGAGVPRVPIKIEEPRKLFCAKKIVLPEE